MSNIITAEQYQEILERKERIEWYESGQNVPMHQHSRDIAEVANAIPHYGDHNFNDAVQIVLFRTWAQPISEFSVLRGYGRIAIVAFTPHVIVYDPILPLPLVRLGKQFNKHFGEIADMVSEWIENYERTGGNRLNYGKNVTYYAEKTIAAAHSANLLTQDELQYFEFNLWKYVSNPALVYEEMGIRPSFETSWRGKYRHNMTLAELNAAERAR